MTNQRDAAEVVARTLYERDRAKWANDHPEDTFLSWEDLSCMGPVASEQLRDQWRDEARAALASLPAATEQQPVAMTREEHHLEYLKQMAAYTGPTVSFDVREPYYLASCDACGWVGSSELCGTDSWGDDSDVYCPRCHASGADCGKVAERIPAPSDQEKLEGWQPIETAPKDAWVLLYRPTLYNGHRGTGKWDDDRYARKPNPYWEQSERWIGKTECRAHPPTLWRPIPEVPATLITRARQIREGK